jgi:adenylate cyclase
VDLLGEGPLLKDEVNRKLANVPKSDLIRDAYVLVGLTALGSFDVRGTPFEANVPGVEIHATILDNLLSQDLLAAGEEAGTGFWVVLALMTLGAFALAWGASRIAAIPALGIFGASFAGLFLLDFDLVFGRNQNWNTAFLYLELSALLLMTLAAKYIAEERKKNFIRAAFAMYLAPAVVREIVEKPRSLVLGGSRRELTVLFSDIRGFTRFSEKMDATVLAEFLNDYLGVMTRIVFECRGTLDKYIGDAVMAFWGAPLDSPSHAADCCRAARRMYAALGEHRARFKERYGVDVDIGIGINTGFVNVGNMGSELSFSYTVIGDSVNLASRLEGATKAYGVRILATRSTLDAITAQGDPLPPHRLLDRVKVKGKTEVVEIFEILVSSIPEEALEAFERGRQAYARGDWDEAMGSLRDADRLILAASGEFDGPSRTLLERCEKLRLAGGPWDGAWEFESK